MARRNRNSERKTYKSDSSDSSQSPDASESKKQRKKAARLKSASPPGKTVPYAHSEVHEHRRLAISGNDADYVHVGRSSVASSNFESLSNESVFQKTEIKKKAERKKKVLSRQIDNNDKPAALNADNVKHQF